MRIQHSYLVHGKEPVFILCHVIRSCDLDHETCASLSCSEVAFSESVSTISLLLLEQFDIFET